MSSARRRKSDAPQLLHLPSAGCGLVLSLYTSPQSPQVDRAVIRATSASSSTSISTTASRLSPSAARRLVSASACASVRGKPSKINPFALTEFNCSRISPITMSSVTSAPRAITSATISPISVPLSLAARSMSPVLSCTMPCSSTRIRACVPLPAPGGPSRIMFIDARGSVSCGVCPLYLCHAGSIFQSALRIGGPAGGIGFVGWCPWSPTQRSAPMYRRSRTEW